MVAIAQQRKTVENIIYNHFIFLRKIGSLCNWQPLDGEEIGQEQREFEPDVQLLCSECKVC